MLYNKNGYFKFYIANYINKYYKLFFFADFWASSPNGTFTYHHIFLGLTKAVYCMCISPLVLLLSNAILSNIKQFRRKETNLSSCTKNEWEKSMLCNNSELVWAFLCVHLVGWCFQNCHLARNHPSLTIGKSTDPPPFFHFFSICALSFKVKLECQNFWYQWCCVTQVKWIIIWNRPNWI